MKNKPFLTASLVFGLIGIALLAVAGISFMTDSNAFAKAIASIMNSDPKSISDALIAELGVVFLVPSFIFAYRSLVDVEYYENKKQQFEEMSEVPETEAALFSFCYRIKNQKDCRITCGSLLNGTVMKARCRFVTQVMKRHSNFM